MRIAYIISSGLESETGVSRKVSRQLTEWGRMGEEVCLFGPGYEGCLWDGLASVPNHIVRHSAQWPWFPNGIVDWRITHAVCRWRPDLIYARFGCRSLVWWPLMRRLPVVFEANTDDLSEARCTFSRQALAYHIMSRPVFLRVATAFVCVTNEIAQIPSIARSSEKILVLANGFEMDSVTPVPPHGGECIRAVFLAGGSFPWHGVDKLIQLASRLDSWRFDVIGAPPPSNQIPSNARFHRRLPQRDYASMVGSADVAFGTLALHRNRMSEACPLKTREYLAFGLPVVIAYDDTDFPQPEEFILKLPNEEGNVVKNVAAIEAFGRRWKGRRVPRAAVSHLDVREKESRRLAFFREVCHE